jgi:hypothetical protein
MYFRSLYKLEGGSKVALGKVGKGESSPCDGVTARAWGRWQVAVFLHRWTPPVTVDESQRPCNTVWRRGEVRHIENGGKGLGVMAH